MILTVILAGGGGGLGAMARYGVDASLRARLVNKRARIIPEAGHLATLVINIIGSFLLGLLAGTVTGSWAALLGTGFCGGFTTMSTASVEAATALCGPKPWRGLVYLVLSVVMCVLAAAAGVACR